MLAEPQIFRALAIRHGLLLYAKARIKANRLWTPTNMLRVAGSYTGKTYVRGQYAQAAADLALWVEEQSHVR